MAKNDLTAQRLRELLHYDPDSGLFTWRIAVRHSAKKAGDTAGCVVKDGYVVVGVDSHYHKAHRLAWLYSHGVWPAGDIDHMNGNRSDNRLCNLRDASKSMNAQNVHGASKRSKSGLLGVRKFGKKWRTAIMIDGRVKHLGTFESAEIAHEAYLKVKREIHVGFLG